MQSTRLPRSFASGTVQRESCRRTAASRQNLDLKLYAVAVQSRPAQRQSGSKASAVLEAQPVSPSQTSTTSPSAALTAATQPRQSRKNIILLDGDTLESTAEHRRIVGAGMALMGALFAVGAAQVHDMPSAAATAAAAASAFLTADLLSGIYHWAVDNYGDGATPVFGSQIAGFQAHHQRPWTITERQFANNVHKVFLPALPFVGVCLAASPLLPGWADVWLSTATFFTVMSQQFHAWSHMKGSELHPAVIAMQDAGLLISRKAHGAHHKAPFEGNYCIVSGFWNPILDAEGADSGSFRRTERLVHTLTGVEPRCWHEPKYEWQSMETQAETAV